MSATSTQTPSVEGIAAHVRRRAEAALAELGVEQPRVELAPPPSPEMGDLGFPCFALARVLRKAPHLIAGDVAERIAPDELIEAVSTDKAYVNITLRASTVTRVVLGQIIAAGADYGGGQADPAEHWMVEYSAPNTNKPLHLGHLRNNLLGSSISRILAFFGHRVTRINLVNDRGVHICKSMLAYQKQGHGTDPEQAGKKGDHLVGEFYVLFDRMFAEEYEAWQGTAQARQELERWLETRAGRQARKAAESGGPAVEAAFFKSFRDHYFNTRSPLGAEVRELLRRWEEGDPEVHELWRTMNGWVLAGFDESYARMGVGFDHVQYESETYKLGKDLVQQGLERGVFRRLDDGAVVCDLIQVGLKGDKILLRGDGTSVYMTQDLGTAMERFERWNLDHLVYVVGDEQNHHFDVLFRVLGLLREGLADACYHLGYGMIRLPEGKMKSREGTVVDADDLMDAMHELARAEIEARAAEGKAHTEGLTEQELELRAERIGMAAIAYYLLKYTPRSSFEYDPRESIDFLGQTGPYCLYNYARTRNLLARAGGEPAWDEAAVARLGSERELAVVRQLMAFPAVVARAAQTLDPSKVADYLFELCRSFAFLFSDKAGHPIATCEDEPLRRGRLLLVTAIGHTLRAGLALLGIEPLEKM